MKKGLLTDFGGVLTTNVFDSYKAFCEAKGDEATARLYRDVIQPDEEHHHGLGRTLLARLAVTDEDQARARAAAAKTLAIADEIQEIARTKAGIVQSILVARSGKQVYSLYAVAPAAQPEVAREAGRILGTFGR